MERPSPYGWSNDTLRRRYGPDGCLFIAEIHLRIGPLGRRANKKELDAVRKHMRDEGVNIKRILEARSPA